MTDALDPRPLARLDGVAGTPLVVRKPSWRSGVHLLEADGALVGRLERSGWRDRARAEAAAGTWTFVREGGWTGNRLAVLEAVTGRRVGGFRLRGWTQSRGRLELDGGGVVELRASGFSQNAWRWSARGEELGTLKVSSGVGAVKARGALARTGGDAVLETIALLLCVHAALRQLEQAVAAGTSS